jgi:hypothetical protein
VIHTRETSIVLLPVTTRSAVAVANPAQTKLDHLRGGEAVGEHDRLGAAVSAGGEQFKRAAAVGSGAAESRRGLYGGIDAVLAVEHCVLASTTDSR